MNELIDGILGDLALFVRVVDAGGFTAASRQTGMPQPSVSRRISQLESRIGLQLLHRSTRSIMITEAGRQIYDHALVMIAAGEAAASAAQAMRTEISGLVRLTAPVVLGQTLVTPVISDAMLQHPDLTFNVEWTTRRVDLLHDGIDIAVGIGRPPDPDLILVRLGNARRRVFAPPGWNGKDVKIPTDLEGLPVVGLGPSTDAPPLTLQSSDGKASVRPDWRLAANDGALVLEIAQRCGYLAIIPDFLAPPTWRLLLPDWDDLKEFNAVTTASRVSLPKIRYVLDRLKSKAEDAALEHWSTAQPKTNHV